MAIIFPCSRCRGSGAEPGKNDDACTTCGGSGTETGDLSR